MDDRACLAKTLYGEARGEYAQFGIAAFIAVGNVIMNRLLSPQYFGDTVSAVCLKPFQFSCWNADDPNRKVISGAWDGKDSLMHICGSVADGLLSKTLPDLTQGAHHYHSLRMGTPPSWAEVLKHTVDVGHHRFYR